MAMFAGVVQCLVVLWIANQASFACAIIFKELYEKGMTVVNLYISINSLAKQIYIKYSYSLTGGRKRFLLSHTGKGSCLRVKTDIH